MALLWARNCNQIVFYDTSGEQIGYGEEVSYSGGYEIVPIVSTPEPSMLYVGSLFAGFLVWRRRTALRSPTFATVLGQNSLSARL